MDELVTKRNSMFLEMYIGIIIVLMLLLIILSAAYFPEVDGYKQSGQLEKTPETFYIRGDLSAKTQEESYGGEIIGDFTIIVNVNNVKILASLDDYSQHRVIEAWLVDSNMDQMLNAGTFDANKLFTSITIESWSYDVILIIEKIFEDQSDTDITLGGSHLEKESKYKSCKCR